MTDIVSPLLQWLNAHPELSGLVTFIISAGESVAIIGTIVPGTIMMTALGMLAGAGVIPLWQTIIWAIIGAIVGDGISYWFGYYFKDRLPNVWPFRRYPAILQKGEVFFNKYGSMSVFIGRFVGPVRALVPLIAGMLGMPPWRFTIANVTSAIGWAPIYMLPGILLGAVSLELPPDIAVHVMLVLLLIILFVLLCLWFVYKLLQLIKTQINQMQDNIWSWLKRSRQFSSITILLKDYNSKQTHGQLNLAFYFILSLIFLFALIAFVKYTGASHIGINDVVYHLFRGLHNPFTTDFMINITFLGQKEVVFPILITLGLWLVWRKRYRSAIHIGLLGVLIAGCTFILKNIIRSPRPWGILYSRESFSMPSGHAVLCTTIFFALAFLISRSLPPRGKRLTYVISLLLILAVSISRLYLGAHWFTDVIAGWLLGASILIFVLISYQRQPEKHIPISEILIVTLGTVIVTYATYHHLRFNQAVVAYTQIDLPNAKINMHTWWEKDVISIQNRTSLFGFPTQAINIEWVGNIEAIKTSLLQNGWQKPPARDWISTLHRIADVGSSQYLPMISPQFLDKRPEMVLTQQLSDEKNLAILRLWKTNYTITETKQPVWVGTVGIIPSTYSWLYQVRKKRDHATFDKIANTYLFTKKLGVAQWEQKVLVVPYLSHKKYLLTHKMLMLRPHTSTK